MLTNKEDYDQYFEEGEELEEMEDAVRDLDEHNKKLQQIFKQ